jgi:hypothetical protein
MKPVAIPALAMALVAGLAATFAWQAKAGRALVIFPGNFAEGVHYATVTRGNITEEIFTSRAAIDAVKQGEPVPSGTVITLVDYRDGKLFRCVVMEKRTGWGAEYPPELRNGEWEFQAFNAERSVNESENVSRLLLMPQVTGGAGLRVHARPHEEREIDCNERIMPHVIVKLWHGKSDRQERELPMK